MKFPLSWLKDHLDTSATLDEISRKLTAVGLEVEGIKDPARDLAGFVVGHVVSCEKHPDADKLKCLVVDTGTEKLKVVCGAPNARLGLKGVFAPAGSYIPGLNVTLKKTAIRGAESNGMMCSERELLLSDEHNGIIDLPEHLPAGMPAAEALGLNDPVIEINLTPNRGDCAAVRGIARDLAAAGLGRLKPLDAAPVKGGFQSKIGVKIEDAESCPLFIGRTIRGVKNGPSPKWLQDRLVAAGLRPISALVDITNYLTVGLGRPAHVFDAAKIKGDIRVRFARRGETLAALNDKTYELDPRMTVICDDTGVLGLGGVIGGAPSGVTEATTDVYLEIAYFEPARIAKAGQALQIDSDARYRFERGIDPAFCRDGCEIATRMILDLCGGEASEPVVAGAAPVLARPVSYDPARLKTLGGSDLPADRQREILESLGFAVAKDWTVTPPSWRHDIDGAADMVEEVLRIDGYDNIPSAAVMRDPSLPPPVVDPLRRRAQSARQVLTARGLSETVTWSFLAEAPAILFGANDEARRAGLTLLNPISADLSVMRPSILPNLLAGAGRNADRGLPDAALFEVGNIYRGPEPEAQRLVAAGLRLGQGVPRHWSGPARAVDVYDAKADAMAVLEACGVAASSLQVSADAPAWYHPGRSGVLRQGALVLAHFGELHPAVLEKMERSEPCAAFEVMLADLPVRRAKGARRDLLKPSPFQPLTRDFAVVLDQAVEADKLIRAVRGADKALIAAVEIFDVYAGKGVEPGRKSVAFAVTIQPQDKTLTEPEIAALSQKIVEAVQKQTGGVLRA